MEAPRSGKLVTSIALAPDGSFLATGCRDHVVRLWDPRTGRLLRELKGHDSRVGTVAVSGDSRRVVSSASRLGKPTHIHVWDLRCDSPLRSQFDIGWTPQYLGLSPNGKLLVGLNVTSGAHLLDAASGKTLGVLPCSWDGRRSFAFSPDGQVLATAFNYRSEHRLRFWEAPSGTELRRFSLCSITHMFSPDGKTLAYDDNRDGLIHLIEVATGKERGRAGVPEANTEALAFVAHGRALAWNDSRTARVTDLATGKELRRFTGQGEIEDLAAADSFLVTRGHDATALVWNLGGLEKELRPRNLPRRPEELDALWRHLSGADAAKAYQALWGLVDSANQAVALLRVRVPPAGALPRAEGEKFARLLADLDAPEFTAREKATDDMAKMGATIEAAVRVELRKGPASAEVRRRLQQVLQTIVKGEISADVLRPLRAVEVLEYVGTAEAKQVLAALAQGVPEARLTQEAKAAVERLGRKR